MRKPIRQGDILLMPVEEIPAGIPLVQAAHKGAVITLAYGETTGHAHRVIGDIVEYATTADHVAQWIRIGAGPAQLVHDTHGAASVAAGAWRVVGQQEYAPAEIRRVLD